MIPIVFLFYKNTKTFKDYHSYEKVHGKCIKFVGKMNYQSDKSKLQIIGGCVEEKAQQPSKRTLSTFLSIFKQTGTTYIPMIFLSDTSVEIYRDLPTAGWKRCIPELVCTTLWSIAGY